jgi:hypothetical protein
MDNKYKYLKYKTKYLNALSERNIYEQYGGKINNNSLKLALKDFSLFFTFFKTLPENATFISNIEKIILFKDSDLGLLDYMTSIGQDINSKYIGNDLDIVLNYTYQLFLQMIPFVNRELESNIKADKKIGEGLAQNKISNEDTKIALSAPTFKSSILGDLEKNGDLNYMKVGDVYFCRCKLLKDVLYYILLCHLFIAKESAEPLVVIEHKSDKASLLQKITEKKNKFLTTARGQKMKDMFDEKESGSVPGSLGSKTMGRGNYNILPDFSCMVNVLFTILNVSMFIYECKIDSTACVITNGNVETLNKEMVEKIIVELKTSVGGFSKSGCSGGLSLTTIKQKVTNKLEGNKTDMVVRLLVEKINRACAKLITPEEIKKIKLLEEATSLFYSSVNIAAFAVLNAGKMKPLLQKHVDNFCDGIEVLMTISKKCIVQKGGSAAMTPEMVAMQYRSILLVVKAILMGIALGLIYEGVKGLITSGGVPHSVAIAGIKLLLGSFILIKVKHYLK